MPEVADDFVRAYTRGVVDKINRLQSEAKSNKSVGVSVDIWPPDIPVLTSGMRYGMRERNRLPPGRTLNPRLRAHIQVVRGEA